MRENQDLTAFLAGLEQRHLADLTLSEVARALRALSSCYVERRRKLAAGAALDSAGKRAAFALFYAPLHFLVTREVVRALPRATTPVVTTILDIGCGTGAAGAAWAIESGSAQVIGVDRHPWAVAESQWTYRQLGIRGRALQADAARTKLPSSADGGIVAAYTINELPDTARDELWPRLLDAHARGTRVLIIEPVARGIAPWWEQWRRQFETAGGEAHEWRFDVVLPPRQQQLGRAAGLDPRELTARTLFLPAT